MKTMYIKDFSNKNVAIQLQVQQYAKNWQMAILLYTPDGEYYSDLSVFVEEFDDKCYMCLDTNNLPNAEQFVDNYNLWTLVGYAHSGFCSYPIYDMNLDELENYDAEWVEKFRKDNNISKQNVFDRLK